MACIAVLVEGHGETEAMPILIRRLLQDQNIYDVGIARPVRLARGRFLKADWLNRSASLASVKCEGEARGLLVVFDADGDCPVEVGKECFELLDDKRNVGVIVAHHEFEAWFLASLSSLQGQRGISKEAYFDGDPDEVANPKRVISQHMLGSRTYIETVDQAPLAQLMSLELAERSRSFRKLRAEINRVVERIRRLDAN